MPRNNRPVTVFAARSRLQNMYVRLSSAAQRLENFDHSDLAQAAIEARTISNRRFSLYLSISRLYLPYPTISRPYPAISGRRYREKHTSLEGFPKP